MNLLAKALSATLAAVIAAGTYTAAAGLRAKAETLSEIDVSYTYDNTKASGSKASESEETEFGETPFNVFDIYAAHQEYMSGFEEPEPEPEPEPDINRLTEGIDVSYAQGDINWKSVKETGIDFAIIRAGYGNAKAYPWQKDVQFDNNIKGAIENNIDRGVYWYSYATTVEAAYEEAESCYEIIKDYDFQYPIYFDIEDPSQMSLSTKQISEIVEAFCSRLQSKGYYVGVYSYANLLTTKIFASVLEKYDVWVANVGVKVPDYKGSYGMWQYSWKGRFDGIKDYKGNYIDVDLDHCYINYPYLISPETYSGPKGTRSSAPSAPSTPVASEKNVVAKGIDVSEWQGDIDWKAVKASGIDFAIIRAGYGMYATQKDVCFDKNIAGAKAAGIDCGVYWYSYATNVDEALREAEVCYEIIKDNQYEYPLYFCIESYGVSGMNAEQISKIADTFCSYMEQKGYYVAIQSYSSFLASKFQSDIFEKYDVCVAHHGAALPDYAGVYGMWQYCSDGTVKGISTPVNKDYAYYDFPSIMKSNNLNGF